MLGRAAHDIIAELAADGLRHADFERVTAAVHRHPVLDQPTVRRQAAKQWLCGTVAIYFRLFSMPTGWTLLGAEVDGPRCRFDLVWRCQLTGEVVADEVKAGKLTRSVGGPTLIGQLARQLPAGKTMYGAAFLGVRVVFLAAPRRSRFVHVDGTRALLFSEQDR